MHAIIMVPLVDTLFSPISQPTTNKLTHQLNPKPEHTFLPQRPPTSSIVQSFTDTTPEGLMRESGTSYRLIQPYVLPTCHNTRLTDKALQSSGGPPLVFDHQMTMDCEAQILYVSGGRVIDGDWDNYRYGGLYSYNVRQSKWKLLQYVCFLSFRCANF